MFNTRMPSKVREYAEAHDVEKTCVEAGPGKECIECRRIIMAAFVHFYGHLEDPRAAIKADLALEAR